jgi:hypothetical protein
MSTELLERGDKLGKKGHIEIDMPMLSRNKLGAFFTVYKHKYGKNGKPYYLEIEKNPGESLIDAGKRLADKILEEYPDYLLDMAVLRIDPKKGEDPREFFNKLKSINRFLKESAETDGLVLVKRYGIMEEIKYRQDKPVGDTAHLLHPNEIKKGYQTIQLGRLYQGELVLKISKNEHSISIPMDKEHFFYSSMGQEEHDFRMGIIPEREDIPLCNHDILSGKIGKEHRKYERGLPWFIDMHW